MSEPLRILGTNVTLIEDIRLLAERDLGIGIQYENLDGVASQQKGVLEPESYDIIDLWFNNVDLLWTAGAVQPIDTGRIVLWDEVGDLTKTGRLTRDARFGAGANPSAVQFVQEDGNLGPKPQSHISMLPTAHNADSFIYKPEVASYYGDGAAPSWSWLLDERWSGRCALLADPAIGIADIAMSAKAAHIADFEDVGNLTHEELDDLFGKMISRQKNRQFRHFWSTFDDSVKLMSRPKMAICTAWSPAITSLRASGHNISIAVPKEGYRGWHSGMCLSSRLNGGKLDAAYAFLNWWLNGKPGAIVARQGYYMSIPDKVREYLSENEWNYWYGGLPATEPILDQSGVQLADVGDSRDGGSHESRMSDIAVWSTLMDEQNYLVRRWSEFLAA